MLILGGISGAGMTTFLEGFRPIFMVLTFGLLAAAFYITYRPRPGASASGSGSRSSKIMTFNKVMLWFVAVFAIVFLFFPQTFTGLLASSDTFTADMDRTTITIEGMT